MKKIIKFIFLIIGYLSFSIGIANAQGFWVKFIDGNDPGSEVNFTLYASNNEDQTYYIGVATTDHTTIYDPLLKICAGKDNSTNVSWEVGDKGFLIYDIYLTPNPDGDIYYWTSQGDAVGRSTGATLSIDWFSGNSKIAVFNFDFSSSGDSFQIVPIPSALWLLGSGVIALGLIRKKLLSC